ITGTNAQQLLSVGATATGSFSLGFPYYGGSISSVQGTGVASNLGILRTVPLQISGLTAVAIQAALESLPNIGIGNVVVTRQAHAGRRRQRHDRPLHGAQWRRRRPARASLWRAGPGQDRHAGRCLRDRKQPDSSRELRPQRRRLWQRQLGRSARLWHGGRSI